MPGPTSIPARVAQALAEPIIDHRGPEFAARTRQLLPMVSDLFRTTQPVVIYPSSGTGAAEAALVNTLSPGDLVLAFNSGFFAERWNEIATRYGLRVRLARGDWEHAVRVEDLAAALREDRSHHVKAVLAVHSETSTGLTAPIAGIREALDEAGHPALLLVDAISSLGTMSYEHDSWGADVTIASSQKGLMLPPGLGFNAVSARALAAAGSAGLPRSYWAWSPILEANKDGYYPYTPPISLLAGLHESVLMIAEETLPKVQARHAALARLTRETISGWGLDIVGPGEPHSNSLTAFWLPPGLDSAAVHRFLIERYDISLGKGLGQFAGRVLRVGHLGDMDIPTLTAALAALHAGLAEAGALPASATPGIASPGAPPMAASPGAPPAAASRGADGADGAGTLPLGAPGEQAR
jgi:alanine-glyoxylate transaminase/serine-glyoxylate transaminase/serine-pyruvate transaminase